MTLKLCIFPNDPIISYYNKGEIKLRYFNPKNFFDEIHIISFINNDIDATKVQLLVGDATLKIHSLGGLDTLNLKKKKEVVLKLVTKINPDVIRAYNSRLEGWLAAYCSQNLHKPFFVSIHAQYDGYRKLMKSKDFKKFLILKYSRKIIEPYVLKNADKITAVYKVIEPYVLDLANKKPEILYNKVDLQRFTPKEKKIKNEKPTILSISRLSPQKNHDIIIKSIKDIDVHLQIIGDGPLRNELKNLVEELNIQHKVTFIKSVPNTEIHNYYQSADIFALAHDPKIEGVPIPVLEALASGMPIVIPKPEEGLSDGLENCVIFADLEPKSFKEQFIRILTNSEKKDELCRNALIKSESFDATKIENREKEIYQELVGKDTRV